MWFFFQCRFYLLWTSSTSDSEAMVGMKRHPVTSQTPLFCWGAAADLKLDWTGHGHHKQRNLLLLLLFVGCNLKSHPKYWIWYDLIVFKTQLNFFSLLLHEIWVLRQTFWRFSKNCPKAKATLTHRPIFNSHTWIKDGVKHIKLWNWHENNCELANYCTIATHILSNVIFLKFYYSQSHYLL